MTNHPLIDAMIAGCRACTADGIFIDPTNLPIEEDTNGWTKEQRRLWWERYYVVKRGEAAFDIYCFDGGCWDRATRRARAASERDAVNLIRRLAGRSKEVV